MVVCSGCKQDLDSKNFSKSQKRKGPKLRRCKKCVNDKKKTIKPAVNTKTIVFNYYHKLVMDSNTMITNDIATTIIEYLVYGVTLHGIYEDLQRELVLEWVDTSNKQRRAYNLNGYTIFLNNNSTFKLVRCEQLTVGYRDYDIDRFGIENKGYKVIEGMYKCINNKKLILEILIGHTFKKMYGAIVYESSDCLVIKLKGCWILDGISFSLTDSAFAKVDKKDCRLLNNVVYAPGYEP